MSSFFGSVAAAVEVKESLLAALGEGDAPGVIREFNEILASIPFDDYDAADKKTKRRLRGLDFGEFLYRSSIYTFLRGAGLDVKAEVHGHRGRSDLAVSYLGRVWVMELKISGKDDDDAPLARKAFDQILESGYADQYSQPHLLGIVINDKKRAITAWKSGLKAG
jgi:hypothetical protein